MLAMAKALCGARATTWHSSHPISTACISRQNPRPWGFSARGSAIYWATNLAGTFCRHVFRSGLSSSGGCFFGASIVHWSSGNARKPDLQRQRQKQSVRTYARERAKRKGRLTELVGSSYHGEAPGGDGVPGDRTLAGDIAQDEPGVSGSGEGGKSGVSRVGEGLAGSAEVGMRESVDVVESSGDRSGASLLERRSAVDSVVAEESRRSDDDIDVGHDAGSGRTKRRAEFAVDLSHGSERLDGPESSLDLSEKLRRLAATDCRPAEGTASRDVAGVGRSDSTGLDLDGPFLGAWSPEWEKSINDGAESADEFTAEGKSDLELLDVLVRGRMKVDARVEGVIAGTSGNGAAGNGSTGARASRSKESRRLRRNSAMQELERAVEQNPEAFSDVESSDDDFVDKSRWRKVEGGPHNGVQNAARKSVRRALRETERIRGSVPGGERNTAESTRWEDSETRRVTDSSWIAEDPDRLAGPSEAFGDGSTVGNPNIGSSGFGPDLRETAGTHARSQNGAGPSFGNGTAAATYGGLSGTDSMAGPRESGMWSDRSEESPSGAAAAQTSGTSASELDDYLSSSVGLEDREMEFRSTRRGRRGVEPMPLVRPRMPRELSRAESLLTGRRRLPAWNAREDLMRAVENNQVVIVSGETGCGKTTQLPQFILEDADFSKTQCNIVCTQPRRISAVSVATRVANERGEQVGDTVGYAVRLDQKRSPYTRLLYCTTGVLLRMMISDPALTHVTHIMVDEIHERGRDEDFLLIVLRDILPKRPDLRLILMSATLNARLFSHYFGNAPVMHIPGFTYPVESLFLEDVLQLTGYTLVKRENEKRLHWRYQLYNPHKPLDLKPEMFSDYPRHVQSSVTRFNDDETLGPDLALVEALLCHICCGKGAGESPRVLTARDRHLGPMRSYKDMAPEGAVLVFLTGWEDIQDLMDALRKNPRLSRLEEKGRVQIMALHGQMPGASQRLIFERPPPGVRKIVLSTNLAETSVTIDDVVHVIDCGLSKEHRYDPLNKLSSLDTTWISKASARQRRGRAGRVQPGICYHLYPRPMYDKQMRDYAAPEMLRTPLEELCLQVKSLEPIMGPTSIESILSRAMEPPDSRTIATGVKMLQSIGAVDRDENLTPLGKHLSELPIDPRLGKMLLMGATFQCLGPILTLAAALSHKDPFSMPGTHKWAALEAKLALAGNTESDHVALIRAFDGWTRARERGLARDFCKEYFLSNSTMEQIDTLRKQYARILTDMGFIERGLGWQAYNEYAADTYLVRAVLCSGLYPQVIGINRDKAYGRVTFTFKDMDAADVDIHPMSVNHKRNEYKMPWMVFSNKIKTAKIYVRDSTPVCDLALVIFGGHIESEEGSGLLKMFDGYVMFTSDKLTASLIKGLRNELQALLHAKLVNPRLDVRTEGLETIEGVRDLLQSSASKGGFGHDMV